MEIKRIDLVAHDMDRSEKSRELIAKFSASPFFVLSGLSESSAHCLEAIDDDKADMALIIPSDFEEDFVNGKKPEVQFLINAIDGAAAGLMRSYALNISTSFGLDQSITNTEFITKFERINIKERFLFNTELNYKHYMAPGILVILVTFIGMLIAGLNLVKEKEAGTIEQLNVTPIKKYQFIIGKLLPFWIISIFLILAGLGLSKLLFNIPIEGNVLLLLAMTSTYLIVVLSSALFISTFSETQQQTLFISWFIVVIFIMMSGILTPIESMPDWAQDMTLINPMAHFAEIVRSVLLKGAGFEAIRFEFFFLLGYGILMLSLAVLRFRKVN